MANIISRPFRFAEYAIYAISSADESKWLPVNPTVEPPQIKPRGVENKFIYVFQRLGEKFELYAELFSSSTGPLALVPGRDARSQERDKRAAPSPLGSDVFTLPHTINGKRAFYTFLVSRIRLPADSIAGFESKPPKGMVQDIDLASDSAYIAVAQDNTSTSSEVQWFLGVTDPATIAENLHEPYENLCNLVADFTVNFAEQTADARKRTNDRHRALLIAKLLTAVFDSDPADKLGLENEIRGGRAFVRQFNDDYDARLHQLITERDTKGEALCFYLNGAPFDFIEQSYRFVEKEEYDKWLTIFSECMDRIGECPMGKARLGKLVDSPDHAIAQYILPAGTTNEDRFGVGRKCTAAIVNLWREIGPALLSRNNPELAQRLIDALGNIVRDRVITMDLQILRYSYPKPNGQIRAVEKSVLVVRAVENHEATLSRWAKDGKIGKTLEVLTMGIEAVNLALSIQAVVNAAEPGDKRRAILGIIGSTADAIVAFNCLLKFGERKVKAAGALSAIIDAYLATVDGIRAYERDDTSSAIGFGAVGLGSVLIFAGCLVAVSGLGASASVVGIPLGILLEVVAGVLVAAGYLINIFGADTDIEQFVSHSKFGVNFPSTSKDPKNKPKWAIGTFADWTDKTDGLSRQVESLMLLLAAYGMEARGPRSLRLTLGLISSNSTVELHFHTDYDSGISHDTTLLIDLTSRTMSHVRGDPQELSLLHVDDSKGHLTIDVTADWPDGLAPKGVRQSRKCTCDVRLNLNDKLTVPLSGRFSYLVADVHGITRILGDPKTSWE